jgi:hypothetical protein
LILSEIFEVDSDFNFTPEGIVKQFHQISIHEHKNIKENVFKILNSIFLEQTTTQIHLAKLERLVKKVGPELFARFLTGFIFKQTRR